MKQIKGFILGIVVAFALMSVPVVADTVQKTIDVFVDYVNVTVNGEAKQVKNFLYDGTTYIALRDVSEVLGYNVGWDGETKTASITSPDYKADVTVMVVNGKEIGSTKFKNMYDSLAAYNTQANKGMTEEQLVAETKKELATQEVVNQKAVEFNVADTTKIREELEAELSAMDMSYGKEMVDQLIAGYYGFQTREEYLDYVITQQINYNVLDYIEQNLPEYKEARDNAQNYYNEHKEEYKQHSAQVKHILIPTVNQQTGEALSEGEIKAAEALAKEIASKANLENFDSLIKENNNDPGQPAEGYLVYDGAGFVDEFTNAAMAFTKVGEVSQPVLSTYGYHVIIATAINEYMPYDNFLKEYLADVYAELDQKTVDAWVAGAEVVYNEAEIANCIK
ncbi:MAG: peptidylprolyl isomerase [Clostridia bacterium]|nr:peptidylprolyl isomerase [Clostridia bacterium]